MTELTLMLSAHSNISHNHGSCIIKQKYFESTNSRDCMFTVTRFAQLSSRYTIIYIIWHLKPRSLNMMNPTLFFVYESTILSSE